MFLSGFQPSAFILHPSSTKLLHLSEKHANYYIIALSYLLKMLVAVVAVVAVERQFIYAHKQKGSFRHVILPTKNGGFWEKG